MSLSEALALKIRRSALQMIHAGRSSHIGSVLSETDILAVLYSDILQVDPAAPDAPDRDRFVLSKGHAGAGVGNEHCFAHERSPESSVARP